MTNELAQELKDAGFGKDIWPEDVVYFMGVEDFKLTSLGQLIKACGKDFNFVCKNPETGLWGAEGWRGDVFSKENSPEEAVAKLWLSLNKKPS